MANDPTELQKLQFDYAWKWFAFHADQRTKVFNFMLVVLGIFLAGIIAGLGKELSNAAAAILCFIASGLAIIFTALDRRNRDLVWLGEEVLMYLERECIFLTNGKFTDRRGHRRSFGILWRQVLEEKETGSDECTPVFIRDAWHGKHRLWFPVIGLLIAGLFIVAGVLILVRPSFLIASH